MGDYISLAAGVGFLYWPYLWCWFRKEDTADYGLVMDYNLRSILQTLGVSAIVLSILTPVAILWPWDDLPHSRSIGYILKMLGSGLAAAVIEETFFRGWVQTMFRKRFGPIFSITATNLIFAPIHLIVAPYVISLATFFPGLIMGALREKYGNIFPSIVFHFLGNVWAIWFFPSPFIR